MSFLNALLDAFNRKPEVRAACYTCADQIKRRDRIYYAAPADKDYWCACCGTKIKITNGAHVCIFFQGLKPGEID